MLPRSKNFGAIAAILITVTGSSDLRGRGFTSIDEPLSVDPESESPEVDALVENVPAPPSLGPLTARAGEEGCFEIPRLRSVHNRATPFTRNGFLFLEEQRTGKSFDRILAERLEAESTLAMSAETPANTSAFEATRNAALRRANALLALDALELRAVLIANEGGSAILNGEVVVVGATVGGTDWILGEVTTQGVVLFRDGEPFALPLAPISKTKKPAPLITDHPSVIPDDEARESAPSASEPSPEAAAGDPKESP